MQKKNWQNIKILGKVFNKLDVTRYLIHSNEDPSQMINLTGEGKPETLGIIKKRAEGILKTRQQNKDLSENRAK